VLSAGPTPHTPLERWDFRLERLARAGVGASVGPTVLRRWSWDAFRALPHEPITVDIHCVTKWSKLDTHWKGVSLDTLLGQVDAAGAGYVIAFADGGDTTHRPIADVGGGRAWIVATSAGAPLPAAHGGSARLLDPQRSFWKSAKWVRGLRLSAVDLPGFWQTLGDHTYGGPWQEQRYQGD
jgi:DMSO/TMAO reductase YedYZ molybdopterin-dependent catalytic subunit